MRLLERGELIQSLTADDDDSLFIDPLLDTKQVGRVAVDFRLGYDFLVSIQTRSPSIEIGTRPGKSKRSIGSYFQETRRELGAAFIVHPGQVVLATTLEYLSLPVSMTADVYARSSYVRLGLPVSGTIQPGFRGCVPIELFNHGNTPIELIVGARICQIRFFQVSDRHDYLSVDAPRKYFGNVRPQVSAADRDEEIVRLSSLNE